MESSIFNIAGLLIKINITDGRRLIIATHQRVVAVLLLQLEDLFCSIHLLHESLIFIVSTESSGIYTKSIRSN